MRCFEMPPLAHSTSIPKVGDRTYRDDVGILTLPESVMDSTCAQDWTRFSGVHNQSDPNSTASWTQDSGCFD